MMNERTMDIVSGDVRDAEETPRRQPSEALICRAEKCGWRFRSFHK